LYKLQNAPVLLLLSAATLPVSYVTTAIPSLVYGADGVKLVVINTGYGFVPVVGRAMVARKDPVFPPAAMLTVRDVPERVAVTVSFE
jgi:hypothetical protein